MAIVISSKDGVDVRETALGNISVDAPSIVKMQIGPEQVAGLERSGSDLVVRLINGETIVIANFFVLDEEGSRSELILEDSDGVQWWTQYSSSTSEFNFVEVDLNMPAAAVAPEAGGIPAWVLAGLALLGVGALIAALDNDDDDGDADADADADA
ncbi:MAG: BapA prefix-like domain-containing protein, partial [Porticoccaceae bacterium]|nr:BapA prefix-like domain-containing protein [Porticoccaceae bacterium]